MNLQVNTAASLVKNPCDAKDTHETTENKNVLSQGPSQIYTNPIFDKNSNG